MENPEAHAKHNVPLYETHLVMVFTHKEPERVNHGAVHDEHDVPLYETQLEIAGTHVVPERAYPEVHVLLAKANRATRTRSLLIFAIIDLN